MSRPAARQWDILLDFFEHSPEMISGRSNTPNAKQNIREKWETLAMQLNCLGYANKSTDKWIKTWTDFKSSLKKKAAEIKKDRTKTGGGPPSYKPLNEYEERALKLLGSSFIGLDVFEAGLSLDMASSLRRNSKQKVEANLVAQNMANIGQKTAFDNLSSPTQSIPPAYKKINLVMDPSTEFIYNEFTGEEMSETEFSLPATSHSVGNREKDKQTLFQCSAQDVSSCSSQQVGLNVSPSVPPITPVSKKRPFMSPSDEHNYGQKRRNKNAVEQSYEETISVLKGIDANLDLLVTHVGSIANSLKIISNSSKLH